MQSAFLLQWDQQEQACLPQSESCPAVAFSAGAAALGFVPGTNKQGAPFSSSQPHMGVTFLV